MISYEPINLNNADVSLKKAESIKNTETSFEQKILEKQRSHHQKTKIKNLKIALILILTHSFAFLLALPPKTEVKIIKKDLLSVKIKAKSFIDLNKDGEIYVDIYSSKKEKILERVLITPAKNRGEYSSNEHDQKNLEVQVGLEESAILSTHLEEELLLFPYGFKFQKNIAVVKSQKPTIKVNDPYRTNWSQYE